MIYELINPSDTYTLSANDFLVAAAVALLLGQGAYGLCNESGEIVMPIMLFGDTNEFVAEKYGDIDEWVVQHLEPLAECFDSVMTVGFSDRAEFDLKMQELEPSEALRYRAELHDRNRSSMNDIGYRAWEYAKIARRKMADKPQ